MVEYVNLGTFYLLGFPLGMIITFKFKMGLIIFIGCRHCVCYFDCDCFSRDGLGSTSTGHPKYH